MDYLGLPDHPLHALAARYMTHGGRRDADVRPPDVVHDRRARPPTRGRFFDALQRIYRATDLGRIKSVATIPAISTHHQQGEEGRRLAGIPPTMVRLCVGGEHPDDVIADLDQALARI